MKIHFIKKEISKKYSFDYVDFHSQVKDEKNLMKKNYSWDGLHPHGQGYAVMAAVLRSYLKNKIRI